jgi:hypothetical protein
MRGRPLLSILLICFGQLFTDFRYITSYVGLAQWSNGGKATSNTFFGVSVWVGVRFILLPLRDHLGPFLTEVLGKGVIELHIRGRMLLFHSEGLQQTSKK